MFFDHTIVPGSQIKKLSNGANRPGGVLTRFPTLVNVPSDCPMFDDFGPLDSGSPTILKAVNHYSMEDVVGSTLNPDIGTPTGSLTNRAQTSGGQFNYYLAGGDCASLARDCTFSANIPFKTITAWVQRWPGALYTSFIQNSARYGLRCQGDGTVRLWNGSANVDGGTSLTASVWTFVCLTESTSSNTHYFWKNGTRYNNCTTNMGGVFRCFGENYSGGHYAGAITNVQVFDYVLTSDEIALLYDTSQIQYKKFAIVNHFQKEFPVEIERYFKGPDPVYAWSTDDITGTTMEPWAGTIEAELANVTPTVGGPYENFVEGENGASVITQTDFGENVSFKSLSFWMRRDETSSWTRAFCNGSNYGIRINTSAQLCLAYNGGYSYCTSAFNINNTSTWYHIVIVESTSNNYHWVYRNAIKDTAHRRSDMGGTFRRIGAAYTTNHNHPDVTNIQVFDYQLSDEEILALYEAGDQFIPNAAQFWVPPDFSDSADTSIYLKWDGSQPDNIFRSAADASDDFTGADGDAPDANKWKKSLDTAGTGEIANNRLEMFFSTAGVGSQGYESLFDIYGKFDIQVDVGLIYAGTTLYWDATLRYYIDADNYAYIQFVYSGGRKIYTSGKNDGVTFTNTLITSLSVTKFNIILDATSLRTYYWSGSAWTLHDTATGFTTAEIGIVKLSSTTSTTSQRFECYFDNFTINSADSITGLVGDTGSVQAQIVWPPEWKARWGMGQDPADGANSILDSTLNAIHLSPTNMDATNLVSAAIGKGLLLNGTDEYLTTATEAVLNLTDELTIIAKIKPTTTWDVGLSSNCIIIDRQSSDNNDSYALVVDSDGQLVLSSYGGTIQSTKASWAAGTEFIIAGTYKATGLTGDLYVDGVAETLLTDSYDSMAGVTSPARVGALAGIATEYADMAISELQVVGGILNADAMDYIDASLTDSIWAWSDYEPWILQWWDEEYGNAFLTKYWDEVYSMTVARLQWWDEMYGMQLTTWWDETYSDCPTIVKFWNMLYGDNPALIKYWDEKYGDVKNLIMFWDLPYNIRAELIQFWNEIYSVANKSVTQFFDENYDLSATNPLVKYWNEVFQLEADDFEESSAVAATSTLTIEAQPAINDTFSIGSTTYTFVASASSPGEVEIGTDVVETQTLVVAAIEGDGINQPNEDVQPASFVNNEMVVVASVAGTSGNEIITEETFSSPSNFWENETLGGGVAGVACYLDGIRVFPYHTSFEFTDTNFKATAEMHFADQESYLLANENQTVMRIIDTDVDISLQVTIPLIAENPGQTVYVVPAESKSRVLQRAATLNETFGPGLASTICIELAARYGITITWNTIDWYIKTERLIANDETPYEIIHKVTQAVGAKMQPTLDGDVMVVKSMEVNSDKWGTTEPEYQLTSDAHFIQTGENPSDRPGYNKYSIYDYTPSEGRSWLEEEVIDDYTKILKGFRYPYDGIDLNLHHSHLSGYSGHLQVVPENWVTEEIEEEIEIKDGGGTSSTKFPVFTKISQDYGHNTNLGNVTLTEEGVVSTVVEGQSIVKLKYRTRYMKWIAKDTQIEKVQFWID